MHLRPAAHVSRRCERPPTRGIRAGNCGEIGAGHAVGTLTCSMSRSTGPALPPPRSDDASDIIGASQPRRQPTAALLIAPPRPPETRRASLPAAATSYGLPRWARANGARGGRSSPARRGEDGRVPEKGDPGGGRAERGLGGEEAVGEGRDRGEWRRRARWWWWEAEEWRIAFFSRPFSLSRRRLFPGGAVRTRAALRCDC
jgi:hypothetical protein